MLRQHTSWIPMQVIRTPLTRTTFQNIIIEQVWMYSCQRHCQWQDLNPSRTIVCSARPQIPIQEWLRGTWQRPQGLSLSYKLFKTRSNQAFMGCKRYLQGIRNGPKDLLAMSAVSDTPAHPLLIGHIRAVSVTWKDKQKSGLNVLTDCCKISEMELFLLKSNLTCWLRLNESTGLAETFIAVLFVGGISATNLFACLTQFSAFLKTSFQIKPQKSMHCS